MIDYSEDRRILKQAIDNNKLAVFVGAGASVNSGIPLWKDAIKNIYDKIAPTALDKNEMLKIPQAYFNARGKKEYTELVKDIFKYYDKTPNKIHELIVKLNPCYVITTNYDDFLEKAFNANGEFLDVVQKDTEIPYCKNSRMIIKMHGGFTYNNFVFKEDDYLNYSRNFALIETFIKALVAKNVILFIGYSYNDPDTKQIFTWVKNILGDSFQRAYFLDAKNHYDLHTINYYKNLGINIIYAHECLKELDDNIYENTIKLLEYIVNNEHKTDIVNAVYNRSKYLLNLNYIMIDYITNIFSNFNVLYKNSNLIMLSNEYEELFRSLNECKTTKKFNRLSNIKEVLNKTIIKNVCIYDNKANNNKILCSFNNQLLNDKFYEYIDNQNFSKIKEYTDSTNISIVENNQEELRIAYSFYELQQYEKCYFMLKKVSLSYKQQRNYIWYFIAEFNRFHIGKFINSRIYFNTNEKFKNEIQKIDLNGILYNNALKGKNENGFLEDIKNFIIVYKTLLETIKSYDKVEEDAHIKYISKTENGNIYKLKNVVLDFYNYLKVNYLMIDIYSEVKEVFKQYINAVFCSHSREKKKFKDGIFGSGENIVLEEISAFDVDIICRYVDKESLDKILKNNDIKKIILSIDAEKKLFEIFNNYFITIQNKILFNYNMRNKIFVILRILEISNLSRERMTFILNKINDLMSENYFQNTDYININRFIVQRFNYDKTVFEYRPMMLIIKTICNNFRLGVWENTDILYLHKFFKSISYIFNNIFSTKKISDTLSRDILESGCVEFLPVLFPIASDNIKEEIKNKILLKLKENDFNYELYCDSISAEIIHESKEIEDRLLKKVEQIFYNEQNSSKRCFPDPLESITVCCINLYLNNKLIEKEKFEHYFKQFPRTEFLYNMNNFDYKKFQLSWFMDSNETLKKIIIQNRIACGEIKKLYKKILKNNDYDQIILDEYLEYFD